MTHARTWLFFTLLLCCLPVSGQSFARLAFQAGQQTSAGGFLFDLREPDNAADPHLWQGPLLVSRGPAHCTVDASLVQQVYLSGTGGLLVIVSLSGSSTHVDFFAPETCLRRKWPPIQAFTEGASIAGSRLRLLPACACPEPGKPCSCTAGSVYQLREDAPPRRLPAASLALTKQTLGVAFSGTRLLTRPSAAIAP